MQNLSVDSIVELNPANEEDVEEEVELPPPMEPISETLLVKKEDVEQRVCTYVYTSLVYSPRMNNWRNWNFRKIFLKIPRKVSKVP